MLTVKNIVKTYEVGGRRNDALKDVSISFRENEFVSILGHSGSGKTTLLNIIGGLDQYTSGDLFIDGVSTKKYKSKDWDAYRNHSIGFIFQSYNLITHQSVLRNVELALTISGIKRKERKQRAIEVLKRVGLEDHIYKKPNQLSGGQMQRVAIARALINDPKIILADEPTGALDSATSVQVMDILKEIAKDRLVIMVTHNPELANEYSTRIISLTDGRIVSDTNPYYEEVRHRSVKRVLNKSMSFLTAFTLSMNNLLTKRGRTIMTAFAGSIGIIGIALIFSVSNGFQNYIDKIQEDTLSTYPFTITTESANLTNMMVSMMNTVSDEKVEKGIIVESQIVNDMFANIDTNNITAFKKHYENNATEDLKKGIATVKYTYDVAPKIYSKSFDFGVTRLHPSSMFAQASSYMSMSFINTDSVFQEMTTNYQQYYDNYDVLAGKWPQQYNECVLVLQKDGRIADYMLYQLGLRDPKELETMISNLMKGKTTKIDNEQMIFEYDDFLNLKFALVPSSSLYRYNKQYDVYEDMSSDKDYMKDIVNNAEEIKVVGIVAPKDGATSKTLTAGIAYRKELTEHAIEVAKKSEIVKKQLANKDIDVFSNTKFKTTTDETNESKLNFKDLVTVDEDMIKDAFKVNISEKDFLSEDDIKKIIENTTTAVSANINANTIDAMTTKLKNIDTVIAKNMINNYITTHTVTVTDPTPMSVVDCSNASLASYVTNYFSSNEFKSTANTLINLYNIPVFTEDSIKLMSKDFATQIFNTYMGKVKTEAGGVDNVPSTYFVEGGEDVVISAALENEMTKQALQYASANLVKTMTTVYVAQGLGTTVAETMAPIQKMFSGDIMTIDTDKFSEAFKFNSSEEEMQRIINTFMNGSEDATYEGNLAKLDYADRETPKSMSFYFINFEAKENFIKFLDDYNNNLKSQGNEKDVIKYTDVTGILMSSVKNIVDAVSYTLIAFVAISLVVSSIMIGVITLISVMERTKEIGILRAIGASKKDVSRVFNVETFIIGLLAGLMGIGVSYIALIPINSIIHDLTGVMSLNASLPIEVAGILVVISILLTLIAGLIPASSAAKKNPVDALRTE